MNLWLEYNSILYENTHVETLAAVQELQKRNMRDHFLKKLRSEFETVRRSLMNQKPVPDLDECFQ